MFFKISYNKKGIGYNVRSRILITYPIVFTIIISFLFYILNSSTDEIKYNLRVFNMQIQTIINDTFNDISKELEFHTKHIDIKNLNNDLVDFDGNFIKKIKAYYILNPKSEIVYQYKTQDAYEILTFDMPWIDSVSEKNKFTLSSFAFKEHRPKAIFVAHYIKNGYKILVEIDVDYIINKIKNVENKNHQAAYLVDYSGNYITSLVPSSNFDTYEKMQSVSNIDEYFVKNDVIDFSYLRMSAKLISYNDMARVFVATYTPKYEIIAFELFILIFGILLFLVYAGLTISNIIFARKYVKQPLQDIAKYIKDRDFKPNLGFISEYEFIFKTLEKLYGDIKNQRDQFQDYKARFGYIFEQSPLIILTYDAYDGKIVDASKEALEFYGYDYSEIMDLSINDIVVTKFSENVFDMRKTFEGRIDNINISHMLKNGQIRDVAMTNSLINVNNRRYIFSIITDITQKELIRENESSLVKYRNMFNQAIIVSHKDDIFKIKHATKNIERLFGIEYAQILQKDIDIRDYVSSLDRIGFVNEVELGKRFFNMAKTTKDNLAIIVRLKTPNVNNAYYKVNVKFLKNEIGEFDGVVYNMLEYSEQKAISDKHECELKYVKNIIWASNSIPFEFDFDSQTIKTDGEFSKILGIDIASDIIIDHARMKRFLGDKFLNFEKFFEDLKVTDGFYEGDIKILSKKNKLIWINVKAKNTSIMPNGDIKTISGVFTEVTDKKIAFAYQELASRLFSYSKDCIAIFDHNWKFIDANDNFCKDIGYSLSELLGFSIHIIDSKLSDSNEYEQITETAIKNGNWCGKIWNKRKNGEDRLMFLNVSAVSDMKDGVIYYVAIFSEIGEIRTTQDYLEHIAYHDPLTKLPNRFLFNQKIAEALKSPKDGKSVAIAYLDMDGFKSINDTYGHKAGDKFLTEISSKIDALFPERDMFARIGGDEFVAIIMYENVGEVHEIAENMLRIACSSVDYEGARLSISASIGVSIHSSQNQISPEDMLEQADWAMYQAKLSGKSRYYVFDASKDKNLKNQYEDNNKILLALENNEFFMEYQPEINIKTNEIISYEALIRWNKDGLIVYPNDFLSLIKQKDVVDNIALFSVTSALKAQSVWQKAGKNASVCVNISIEQLCSNYFYSGFKDFVLKNNNVNPKALLIEIIDANSVDNLSSAGKFLQRYKKFGVSFILDDFASKTSSFETLELLPVDKIKVDKNICTYMFFNKKAFAAVRMIKSISDMFKMAPTIKNLKDLNTLNVLIGLGFNNFQGNFFSKSMSLDEVLKYEFKGINGININYHVSDEEFKKLSEFITLKEYAQNIIEFFSSKDNEDDIDSFEGLKSEILPKLQDFKYLEYTIISDKLEKALNSHDKIEALALARAANMICAEKLNIIQKEIHV